MQIKYSNVGDEPLSVSTVKSYLKVDFSDDDTLITSMITQARELIEEFTGLALVVKTIEYFDEEIAEEILLPFPEHDEITELQLNGEVSTDYYKSGLTQFLIKPNSTEVTSGADDYGIYVKYTTTGNCPEAIKLEMLRLIAEKYVNRGNTFEGPITELSENSYANLAQYCVQ